MKTALMKVDPKELIREAARLRWDNANYGTPCAVAVDAIGYVLAERGYMNEAQFEAAVAVMADYYAAEFDAELQSHLEYVYEEETK